MGCEHSIPTLRADLGDMMGSLVGQSQQYIRDFTKVVDSVSGGNAIWVATCNAIDALPAELQARFSLGTYFFDREGFSKGAGGELAFQAWTATQARYWGWEAGVAVDAAAGAAEGALEAVIDGVETVIGDILRHPLFLAAGVVLVLVVVWAATR
jgi:hypothetical protein